MLARLDERLQSVQRELHTLSDRFQDYVTHVEFKVVRMLVFGSVALILSAVIAAIVASVLHK
jgi:hypothetical protein